METDRFGRLVLTGALGDESAAQTGDTIEVERSKDAIISSPQARAEGIRREFRLRVFAGNVAQFMCDPGGPLDHEGDSLSDYVAGMRVRS